MEGSQPFITYWYQHHVGEDECGTFLWAEYVQGAKIHTLLCAQCGDSAASQRNLYERTEMLKKTRKI
jgi:hypothetical protein